ncbi:MAG: HdeD family acid-resistance protein [Paracoccus sp. (in: a-proteobacteria)]
MKILWIVLGIISILAGILALANPMAATLAAEQIAGWGFLIVGVLEIFLAFRAEGWGARIWAILAAIAFVLLGIALLGNPLEGIVTLTVLAGILFMSTGIFRVIMAFQLRGTGAFWLVLLSGLLAIVLAVMIFGHFPASVVTLLGVLLAIELISNGVSVIALASVVPDR